MTEGYYLYTFDALKGGTVSNGPVKGFGGGGGERGTTSRLFTSMGNRELHKFKGHEP